MNKAIRNVAILMVGVFALGLPGLARGADANPPERMTYQGYLVDGNGAPLGNLAPANYDVIFRIYAVKQGGAAIWAEQQTVTVDKGYFSVVLGEGSQYGSELHGNLSAAFDGADASDRFIGITVEIGDVATEIEPRLRLVSSPYAYTASQARRLTDGSGNSNFFKEGASLRLGAGSTPTLTLPEAGGALLVGKLTADLPSWGSGLQIDNGAYTTTLGSSNSSFFNFSTTLPAFYLNKKITVAGDILSYNTDTILGPSNNTDTYLKVHHDGSDKITAQADEFLVQGDSKYLQMKFTSTAAELRTDASSIYMNKPLEVKEEVTASSFVGHGTIPIGGIIMWSGATTTLGSEWALCDGTSYTRGGVTLQTPNLVDKFVRGATLATNSLNQEGGANTVDLEAKNLPPHKHTGNTGNGAEDGDHWHNGNNWGWSGSGSGSKKFIYSGYVGANADGRIGPYGSAHQHAFTTDNNDSQNTLKSEDFNVVPEYFALAYIMRIE